MDRSHTQQFKPRSAKGPRLPFPCPICEVLVPADATICANCGVKFEPDRSIEDELDNLSRMAIQEMAHEDLSGVTTPDEPAPKGPDKRASKSAARKGLTNGVALGSRPGSKTGKTNGLRGRTNGLRGRTNGLTNGSGRTNGLTNGVGRTNGLTNGLGRTNGITNGLGRTNGLDRMMSAGFHPSRRRGVGRNTGWKLYLIPLVAAALLLLPLFLGLESPGPVHPIRIDGAFNDWASVPKLDTTVGSVSNPNVDIVRFGAIDNMGPFAFYVQMQGTALQGGGPSPGTMDTVWIFLDTDASAATGFRIDGLGADRMIEISGYRGAVLSSVLWEFDANRDVRDWNGWIKGTGTPAASSGSQIEAEAEWLSQGSGQTAVIASVHSESWDREVDTGDVPISTTGGTLLVTAYPQVPNVISGANVSLTQLSLTASRQSVSINSLRLQIIGTASFTSTSSLRLLDGSGNPISLVTPTSRDVTFAFPLQTVPAGTSSVFYVVGDFAAGGGETFGIRPSLSQPIPIVGGILTVREQPAPRSVGYLGAVPSNPKVDGAFSEWTTSSPDPTGDVTPRANPAIDLDQFGSQRYNATTFLYADVSGRMLLGTPVPQWPQPTPPANTTPTVDTDRDGVPDSIDPYPYDFNNDGIPDAQTNCDVDGDGIVDYGCPGGTDYWLNTTIPSNFPAPYAGRSVSVYIGPDDRPPALGDDVVRIFLDIDNSSSSGYSIGGIGADRLVEVRGKDGTVTQSALLTFVGSFPGQWAWTPVSPVTVALGYHAVELSVPFNASRMYLETGDFWGSVDSTTVVPAFAVHASSFMTLSADTPLSVPWQQAGPQPSATLIDPNSNAATSTYNQQRKVVRAGDVSGQTACDATNSAGCWYVVFYDQLAEATGNTQASTETITTGTKVAGTFPTDIQTQNNVYIQYRESTDAVESVAAYRSNTGTNTVNSPKTRTWDGSSWTAETEQATAGSPLRAVREAYSPVKPNERIIVTLSDDGWLDAYVCTPTCSATNNIGQVWSTPPSNAAVPFDIAYEQRSGDALLVYGVLSTNTARDIAYKVWQGGFWGTEQYLDDTTESTDVQYTVIKLASQRGSDRIGLIGGDSTNKGNAWIWGGSAFGNFQQIDSTIVGATHEEVAIGWESGSGNLVAVAIDVGVPRVSYRVYTTSWSAYAQSPDCASTGQSASWVVLKPNPVSTANDMILAMGDNTPFLGTCYWNGSSFVNGQTHGSGNLDNGGATRPFDFAWENTGSKGLLVWGTTAGQITYRTYAAPNTWGTITNVAMGSNKHAWVTLRTNPLPRTGATKILGAVMELTANDLGAIRWDGSVFTVVGASTLTANTGTTTYQSYDLQYHVTNGDQLNVRYDWVSVPAGDTYTLQVKGYREDEDVNVQVLTAPSSWNTAITISATSNTLFSYTLTPAEYNGGAPAIRFVDAAGAGGMQSDFWVDYANIVTNSYWDRVILMRSLDASGSTWGSQITLASGRSSDSPLIYSYDSAEPSIAIDATGFLHLVWVSGSATGNQQTLNRVRYTKTTMPYPTESQLANATNWQSVTVVDDADLGYMPTVSTDSSNNPHVAWSGSKTSGTVYYKNKATGTWQATVSWGTTYAGLSVDVSPQNNFVSLSSDAGPGGTWWDNRYSYREKLTVTAGTVAVPAGYSVSVSFNHASLVTGGKSLASGNDLRVVYWTGSAWTELDRALDAASAWNSAATKIWFKSQPAILASSSDSGYYLYYGNPSAASPPANPANIYLFFDDFETGGLSKWTVESGLWQTATDQAHAGTYALKYPAESSGDRYLSALPVLNEVGVYFDAWWRVSDTASIDVAQSFRLSSALSSHYETNLETNPGGWNIAKQINGAWSSLSPDSGTPATNTWMRVSTAIYGTGMRVFKDGTQINPASGAFNVGTELSLGNIAFRKYNVATGFAWWIDDVVVRRYVDPEPTTGLATEETATANDIRYMVCRNLASNCDTSSKFTRWDGSAGYDILDTAVAGGSYPSLATTYESNADLWIAYAKDVDGTTRGAYARFLDYPTNGFAPAETIDSLSGTQFTRPTIGVDLSGNVYALYTAISGPLLYYKSRTGGTWGTRTSIDVSTDYPSLMVRSPNSALYGSGVSGGVYWKATTSETYFYGIPEFDTVIAPVVGVLLIASLLRRKSIARARKTRALRLPVREESVSGMGVTKG